MVDAVQAETKLDATQLNLNPETPVGINYGVRRLLLESLRRDRWDAGYAIKVKSNARSRVDRLIHGVQENRRFNVTPSLRNLTERE